MMNFELLTFLRNERERELLREAERERLLRSLREQQKQWGVGMGLARYWSSLKAHFKEILPFPRDDEAMLEEIEANRGVHL